MNRPYAKFITFEGGEGAGKTTQIKLVKELIEATTGEEVITTREPGGVPQAELLRNILVSDELQYSNDPLAELLIINASRRLHLNQLIIPSLEQGKWVLCDRYIDSTFVYQGDVKGLDDSLIMLLHNTFCDGIFPEKTIFLDVSIEMGMNRVKKRFSQDKQKINAFDKYQHAKHEQIRQGFYKSLKNNQERFVLINGDDTPEAVSRKIFNSLEDVINLYV